MRENPTKSQAAFEADIIDFGGTGNMQENTLTIQDKLVGALIGLAKTCTAHIGDATTDWVLREGLKTLAECHYTFESVQPESDATFINIAPEEDICTQMLGQVHLEKKHVAPDCATCPNPCGNTDDYDVSSIFNAPQNIRRMKAGILNQLFKLAGQTGKLDEAQTKAMHKGLCVLGYEMTEERLKKAYDEIGAIEIHE